MRRLDGLKNHFQELWPADPQVETRRQKWRLSSFTKSQLKNKLETRYGTADGSGEMAQWRVSRLLGFIQYNIALSDEQLQVTQLVSARLIKILLLAIVLTPGVLLFVPAGGVAIGVCLGGMSLVLVHELDPLISDFREEYIDRHRVVPVLLLGTLLVCWLATRRFLPLVVDLAAVLALIKIVRMRGIVAASPVLSWIHTKVISLPAPDAAESDSDDQTPTTSGATQSASATTRSVDGHREQEKPAATESETAEFFPIDTASTRYESKRRIWASNQTKADIRDRLDSKFRQTETDVGTTLWTYSRWLGFFRYEIQLMDAGRLRVSQSVPKVIKYAVWLLFVSLPLAFLNPSGTGTNAFMLFFGALALYGPRISDPIGDSVTVAKNTHYYAGLLLLLASVGAGLWIQSIMNSTAGTLASIALVVWTGLFLYAEDSFPGVDAGTGARLLLIPMRAVATAVYAIAAFGVLLLLMSVFAILNQFLRAELESGQPVADPEYLRVLVTISEAAYVGLILLAIYSILTSIWTGDDETRQLIHRLRHTRIVGFDSARQRYTLLALFMLLNIGMLGLMMPIFDILQYGVTRDFLFPSVTFQLAAGLLPNEGLLNLSGPGIRNALQMNYEMLFRLFSEAPLIPAGVSATVLLSCVFLDVLIIPVAALYEIGRRPINWVSTLRQIKPIESGYDAEQIPDDIQPVSIPLEDTVDVRPFSLPFGIRKYVIVTEPTLSILDSDELTAVLLHEIYHIENRDQLTDFIATVFSIGLLGKNSLLVFYNYPQIEKVADRTSVRKLGELDPMLSAITKLYESQTQSVFQRVTAGDQPQAAEQADAGSPGPSAIGEVTRRIKRFVTIPYRLYFGQVLLQTARVGKRRRIEQLVTYWETTNATTESVGEERSD